MSRTGAPAAPLPAAPPSAWPMYRAMVGIGLVCGLLIVGAYQLTLPTIERNKAEALQRAIFRVLPRAESSRTFRLVEGGGFAPLEGAPAGEALVYAGYDASGQPVGVAIEAAGMGYQDVIRVLWGYSFEAQAIVGLQVLESKETPGLGDRIESDPDFLANFEALDVSLAADGATLAHPVTFAKHGTKTSPWQIDGITGATISSKAITAILDRSASRWAPLVRRDRDGFGRAE